MMIKRPEPSKPHKVQIDLLIIIRGEKACARLMSGGSLIYQVANRLNTV